MSQVGYSRSTYDIDLWVDKSEENAQNIYKALDEFGVPFAVEPDNFLEPNSVLQIGIAPNRIDILTDIDGLTFEQAWKGRQLVKFDSLEAFTLSINDLIKNKKASNRPKDKLDLAQLEELAQKSDCKLLANLKEVSKRAKSTNAKDYKELSHTDGECLD